METHSSSGKLKKRRSRILYEITTLLVVIFLVFGLLALFVFRSSENRLINKSIEKLKETEANNLSSAYSYVFTSRGQEIMEIGKRTDPQEYITAITTGVPGNFQNSVSAVLKGMVDAGMLGMESNMFIFTRLPMTPKPVVFASSDQDLVLSWQVPDWLADAIDEDKGSVWMDKGIPELGLQGEYLVTINRIDIPDRGVVGGFVGIKSMQEQVAAIKDFYNQDKQDTNLLLLLLIIGSIIVIVAITFLVLSRLIRKRITEPIDELSTAAERVLEGDLDVQITTRKGEEFEPLKLAFKSMVDEFRKLITRAATTDLSDEPEDK